MKNHKGIVLDWIGYICMIVLILVCVPFAVPKLFGIHIYEVESESMEPDYPKGSLLYVRECNATEIEKEDVITYTLGSETDYVMTHRVVDVDEQNRCFITKGDANEIADAEPIAYERVIGCPILCIPYLGRFIVLLNGRTGKAGIVVLFLVVFLMWKIADLWKQKEEDKVSEK